MSRMCATPGTDSSLYSLSMLCSVFVSNVCVDIFSDQPTVHHDLSSTCQHRPHRQMHNFITSSFFSHSKAGNIVMM